MLRFLTGNRGWLYSPKGYSLVIPLPSLGSEGVYLCSAQLHCESGTFCMLNCAPPWSFEKVIGRQCSGMKYNPLLIVKIDLAITGCTEPPISGTCYTNGDLCHITFSSILCIRFSHLPCHRPQHPCCSDEFLPWS